MKRLIEMGANVQWGVFSIPIPGRVGYQCSNYYRDLIKKNWITDPNYKVDGKKLTFQTKKEPKKSKKKAEEYREKAFAFVVHTDWSGVWPNLPACHFQAPKSVKQQMVNGKQINVLNAENYENILNNTEQEINSDMTSTQNSENHLSDVKKRPPKKKK